MKITKKRLTEIIEEVLADVEEENEICEACEEDLEEALEEELEEVFTIEDEGGPMRESKRSRK